MGTLLSILWMRKMGRSEAAWPIPGRAGIHPDVRLHSLLAPWGTTLLLGVRGVWGFFLFSDSLLYYKPCSNKWNACKLEQLGRFHNGKCRELLLEICFCNRQPVAAVQVRNVHAAWTELLGDIQKMFPNWICPWKFRGDLILYHKYGLHILCKLLTDSYSGRVIIRF